MIDWKKYDPFNKPETYKICLVTDGRLSSLGYIARDPFTEESKWIIEDGTIDCYDVTHYAEINLPEGEK